MRRSDLYDTSTLGDTTGASRWTRTGRRSSGSDARQQSFMTDELDRPWDDLGEEATSNTFFSVLASWIPFSRPRGGLDDDDDDDDDEGGHDSSSDNSKWKYRTPLVILAAIVSTSAVIGVKTMPKKSVAEVEIVRPDFVFEHPYISSSYYTSTKSLKSLQSIDKFQVQPKKVQLAGKKSAGEKDFTREAKTRLAILRPFCAFDAGPLPTTFDCE